MKKRLKDQVEDACRALRCSVEQFFVDAFTHKFGKRRCARREARQAAKRFARGRKLYAKAKEVILDFIASLNLTPQSA